MKQEAWVHVTERSGRPLASGMVTNSQSACCILAGFASKPASGLILIKSLAETFEFKNAQFLDLLNNDDHPRKR